MTRHVTVGVDGSPQSAAAARWAAREAGQRAVPLLLLHVEEAPISPETPRDFAQAEADRTESLLLDAADRVRSDHPGLEVATAAKHGRAADELTSAANDAEVMVLGSRALGRVAGFLAGSISLPVVATSRQPVILVRAEGATGPQSSTETVGTADSDILLGLDIRHPCDPLIAFAFGEASRTGKDLRAIHSWSLPAAYGYAAIMDPGIGVELGQRVTEGLADMIRPWRSRFPEVTVTEKAVTGPAAAELIHASRGAALLVVGRRSRGGPAGSHLGHVAQAAIHHSDTPIAVVPHE
ncbi:universal stress protein [Streptomyces sp. NBC_00236]|uniref:universal stress protein n=1 Tax=unclassified Streptomyces TaxID=2593676 RepID=UPI002E2887C9|nr:universal stress protein [Streptomyces sp. NBC_00236]